MIWVVRRDENEVLGSGGYGVVDREREEGVDGMSSDSWGFVGMMVLEGRR